MKKLTALCLALVLALSLVGCSDKNMTFDIGNATQIQIRSGLTGDEVIIEDSEFVKGVTENINSLTFEKMNKVSGVGYTYMLTWMDETDRKIASITITEENGYQISHDGYYYKVGAGLAVDMQPILEMLDISLSSLPAPDPSVDFDAPYSQIHSGTISDIFTEGSGEDRAEVVAVNINESNETMYFTLTESTEYKQLFSATGLIWDDESKDLLSKGVWVEIESEGHHNSNKNTALVVTVFSKSDITQAKLSIDMLKAIIEQKGDNLTWNDFAPYYGEDIGSGMYIIRYPITQDYCLKIVGGGVDIPPIAFYLVSETDDYNSINVLTEDIDDFIQRFNQ